MISKLFRIKDVNDYLGWLIVGWVGLGIMMFNATFNNISVILWWSILLVEETGVLGENHWQIWSHNVVSSTPHHERGSNSQLVWRQALIAHAVVNPTTIRSQPRQPPLMVWEIWQFQILISHRGAVKLHILSKVSEWLLFNAKWAIVFSYMMARTCY